MGTILVMGEAGAFVGFLYLINQFIAKKHPDWATYFVYFLFTCGVLFLTSGNASNYYEDYNTEYTYDYDMLSDAEKKLCAEQMVKCERMAKYHYELSKSKCWWLPNLDERAKARHCFLGAIATLASGTPQSKVVAAVLYALGVYGLSAMDEWNYVNDHLLESKAWWESYEFYKENLESNR